MPHFPVQFGYCVPIFAWPGGGLFRTPNYAALDTATTMNLARLADDLGYDSIWVADHLMLGKDEAILEGWTTLSALAGSTQRAKLGIIHQAHFFRHPSVTAKMIATLDQISGGRFIYFADTGTRAAEHHAYGLHYPATMEDRMPELLEGLELQLALWQTSPQKPLTFNGRYYQVTDAVCTPGPVTQPHPPIWFGEAHPLILEACARMGQGWNSVPVPMDELRRRIQSLKDACNSCGRPFDDIEKTLETQILIAPDRDGIRQALRFMLSLTPLGDEVALGEDMKAFLSGSTDQLPTLTDSWLIGTPDMITQQLHALIDMGFTHFMLWFMDAPQQDGMRLFIDEVTPAFRPIREKRT
ncbi:MAG: LLM class flavin-dependent oxidoreductase [Anaerolineae bacterium]|nr:LLM class flavin-dependent oxidoreductase [Anaerolineae bacterium]